MSIETQIPEEWSDPERWAWVEIQAGRIADFHKRYDQEIDPKKPEGWDDEQKDRRLSQAFLITILTEESFRCATPFKGVRINGGFFEETVDLQHAPLGRQLWLERCRFYSTLSLMNLHVNFWFSLDGSWLGGAIDLKGSLLDSYVSLRQVKIVRQVDLTRAKIVGALNMDGSSFDGKLTMNCTEIGQDLFMSKNAKFKEVDLTGAKIGGHLNMGGSSFDGKLTMNSTEIGQSLFMSENAKFKKVDLTRARIVGALNMDGSSFDGKLTMNSTEIGQDLFMSKNAKFKEVDLTGAKIGGQLGMGGSTFDGKLNLDGTEVGQGIFARSAKFPTDQKVIFHFARIISNLDLSGATIGTIDLTGTAITGELRLGSALGHKPTKWVKTSRMILRNTTIGAIQDADVKTESWPKHLELEGFAYRRLGGFGAMGPADIAKRDSAWFIQWLERDKTFSPQPYEQLANVLRESGYSSKANAILYAARKRSRTAAWERRKGKPLELLRWIGLTFLQYTIGYGLGARYFWVLGWFGGFTLIGFLVLLGSIEKSNWDLFEMAWASFDQVLPIVKLNGEHEKLILGICNNWTIAYFYIQKVIGYVLGGFLGAGLAGLTQKS